MPAVRRKAGTVWNPKATDTVRRTTPLASELAGRNHRHGCQRCSATYEDNCTTPLDDHSCTACRGRTPPLWERDLRPAPCCRSGATKASPEEQTTYRLGGENTWWLCTTCKRPHIYNPGTGTGR